jgi:hypothetical protein
MDPREMAAYMAGILRGQSHAEIIGPIADPAGENGLVLRAGELVKKPARSECGPNTPSESRTRATRLKTSRANRYTMGAPGDSLGGCVQTLRVSPPSTSSDVPVM